MIKIQDTDALAKIAEIEGEEWLKKQSIDPFRPTGFFAFRKIALEEYDPDGTYFLNTQDGDYAIYGSHGYNRWLIRANGEIVFSRHHRRNEEDLTQVINLGFGIYE